MLSLLRGVLYPRGFQFALAGAYAINAYGLGRFTTDLDLIAPVEAQALIVSTLEARGYETLNRSAGYSNHLHRDSALGRVDFIYVEAQTAAKLFPSCRLVSVEGVHDVLVPKPEHLIAMKLHAIKNNPKRRLKDMADIQFLLRSADVDKNEAHAAFEKAGMLEAWDDVLKDL